MLSVASTLLCLGIMESLDLRKTSEIMEPTQSLSTGKKHIPQNKCHIFTSFKPCMDGHSNTILGSLF